MNKHHTIFRVIRKDYHYTRIWNETIRNTKLSLKAKGLLTLMLSFEDGWQFSLEKVSELSTDGITSLYSAYKELKKAGYIHRQKIRDNNNKFVKHLILVYEEPTNNPLVGFPLVGNPMSGKPQAKNTILKKNKMSIINNTHCGANARSVCGDNLLLKSKDTPFTERYGAKIQSILKLHSKYKPVTSNTWSKQINYILHKMNIPKEDFKEIMNWYLKKGLDLQYSPKIYKPEQLAEKWYQIRDAMIKYTTDHSDSHTVYRMGADGEMGYYEDEE